MKSLRKCIHNGRLFNGENYYKNGYLIVEDNIIKDIGEGEHLPLAEIYIDVNENLIMPGLVDLHSDAAERCIEMRPGVFFDKEFALLNLDVRLASSGFTSFFHAVSFGEEKTDVRNKEISEELVNRVKDLGKNKKFKINHYVHFRYEVSSDTGTPSLKKFLKGDELDLVSFMDHTPGQGQFRDLEEYKKFYCANYGISHDEALDNALEKQKGRKEAFERIIGVAEILKKKNIPLMSHDDDTTEKVDLLKEIGINASEFPVTEEAAEYACKNGLGVLMGAPNLLRGKSSNGHLDASKTVELGICTGLLSDYYPESLLQAPFAAMRRMDIPPEKALPLVTSGPGKFLPENSSKGMLKSGLPADFIIVEDKERFVRVKETWVGGNRVYQSGEYDKS